MFVIRDFVGNTPKSELQSVLQDELVKIWNSIEKVHLNTFKSPYISFLA